MASTRAGHLGGRLYTCGRPGRSKGKDKPVPDALVHAWLAGLPAGDGLVLVSLLGRKDGPSGVSEFSLYSFYGGIDRRDERGKKPSFREWLDRTKRGRTIQLVEHPTFDYAGGIPEEMLNTIKSDLWALLSEGRTVVLFDSGGQERTGQVCHSIDFQEETRRDTQARVI
jgi:hypothetical protein